MDLKHATQDDVPRLIDILFSAFANDGLLTGLCYPDTPANRQWWVQNVTWQMTHPETVVMKVVDEKGTTVSWAKWLLPTKPGAEQVTGAVDPSRNPSPDMNIEACKSLAEGQYKMRNEVMGQQDHIWLNAIMTDPAYQRQGAATLLVQHGVKIADEAGWECFSACTTQANENMASVFRKFGFRIVVKEEVTGADGLAVYAGHRKARNDN